MRPGIWISACLALGLAGGVSAQTPGDDYPYQGRAGFSLDGTVNQVDADRDRVTLLGDDGHTYTLDTYRSAITLRGTDRAGETGDLVPGMRLHVSGVLLSRDLVEADRVAVQPYRGARPTRPVGGSAPVAAPGQSVTLRGTVESVDDRRSTFVVRVNDHTRRVDVTPDTDLSDLNFDSRDGSDRLPIRPGDRITVVGTFQDDGSVEAASLTQRRPEAINGADSGRNGRALTGRVSATSDYFSRDIKVRLSVDREIKVRVPKGISIRRDGRAVSVHDLHNDEVVRVFGSYDGGDFKATRIDVLTNVDSSRFDF